MVLFDTGIPIADVLDLQQSYTEQSKDILYIADALEVASSFKKQSKYIPYINLHCLSHLASSSTAPQPNPAVVPPPPPPPPPAPAVPAAQPAPAPVVPAAPAAPPAPSGGSAVAKGFTRLVQIEEDALQQTQQSLRSFQVITIVLAILCCLMAAGLLLQHWRNSEKKNRSPSGYDLVPEKRPLMDHH